MKGFLDDLVVGLVLLASVAYAIYSLGPKMLRTRLLAGMSSLLGRLPAFVGLQGVALRLGRAAEAKATGSCGGCDNCGSEKPAAAPGKTSPNEINIPLSRIVKRR